MIAAIENHPGEINVSTEKGIYTYVTMQPLYCFFKRLNIRAFSVDFCMQIPNLRNTDVKIILNNNNNDCQIINGFNFSTFG